MPTTHHAASSGRRGLRRARISLLSIVATVAVAAATVGVVAALTPGIAVKPTATSVSLLPGQGTRVRIDIAGLGGYSGPVALAVSGTRPSGAAARLSATSSRTGSYVALAVTTSSTTPTGSFTVRIAGTSSAYTSVAYVKVTVTSSGSPLSLAVSGAITVPGPGGAAPIDLVVRNPNPLPVRVSRIAVAITGVTRAASAPTSLPCTASDFAITAYSGPTGWQVPARSSVLLSSAVPDRALWPQLRMINAAWNQDGCRGATVTLSLTGSGTG